MDYSFYSSQKLAEMRAFVFQSVITQDRVAPEKTDSLTVLLAFLIFKA